MTYLERKRRREKIIEGIIGIILAGLIIFASLPFCIVDATKEEQAEELQVEVVEQEVVAEEVQEEIEEEPEEPREPEYIRHDIPMSEEHQTLLFNACQETGCPYSLALSVCWVETGMRNIRAGECEGYMMIQRKWVGQLMSDLGVTDLMDPYSNFLVGSWLLARYTEQYGEVGALTKYNTGHTGSSNYANKVLNFRTTLFSEDN